MFPIIGAVERGRIGKQCPECNSDEKRRIAVRGWTPRHPIFHVLPIRNRNHISRRIVWIVYYL